MNHDGWVSEPFEVLCGIWHECPFSLLAFVLAVELLAIKVRNSSIAGFETPDLGSRAGAKIELNNWLMTLPYFL